MFDFKGTLIKIEGLESQKIVNLVLTIWTGIPKWLRYALITAVVGGGLYYLVNRISLSYDLEYLEEEVEVLNKRCGTTVFYDRYVYDIQNIIIVTKTLQHEIDLLYRAELEHMTDFEELHKKDDSNNHILKNLKYKREHMQMEFDSYAKIINHLIDLYEHNDLIMNQSKHDDDSSD